MMGNAPIPKDLDVINPTTDEGRKALENREANITGFHPLCSSIDGTKTAVNICRSNFNGLLMWVLK